jgi:hypothetical protein
MKRRRFTHFFGCVAAACVGWVTTCAGYRLNPDPLALGMTAQDAANSLRARLAYVTGRAGSEIYVVERTTDIPGLGPVTERTLLQFKDGTLFGWTSGWRGRAGAGD